MMANASFFSDPELGPKYFRTENCSEPFRNRWKAAVGDWDDKLVVDVGCGPGNLLAAIGGAPRLIVGVDISRGALDHAAHLGYTPLLADAQHLPLVDGFADIVTLNAVLHHCDDMARVLSEAARLVRPGGVLITDEDPVAHVAYGSGVPRCIQAIRERFPMYWLPGRRNKRRTEQETAWRLETEIHNQKPGDGVTQALYRDTLTPLGFDLELYPHNHDAGAEVFSGEFGRLGIKDALIRFLTWDKTFLPPHSMACIAHRSH